MSTFISEIDKGCNPDPEKNIFGEIWGEYEKVILNSLVTSFGLDFIVHDQYGGDVDTIFNVRKIGKDSEMKFKNSNNSTEYENRPVFDKKISTSFYQDNRYKFINAKVTDLQDKGNLIDAYTGEKVKINEKINLDHVISKKEIYNDAGRVLSGLSAKDLANCEDNLRPTNESINKSMKDKDINEYIDVMKKKQPERQARIKELSNKTALTDKERKELLKLKKIEEIDPDLMNKENDRARKLYESKIAKAYYTSSKFAKDTAVAAGKRGAEMGVRQAIGFVFVEIWYACKKELQSIPSKSDLKDMLESVGQGIENGLKNARLKYKEIIAKIEEGFLAGALSSLTTTLCNIFFTTAKNLVRIIRQIYASVIQAGKVLFFNPDNLMYGDRIKMVTIILATGASVVLGTTVGELISKTPLGAAPIVGSIVVTFCSTLVSGLLSCTLLIFMDRSKFMNQLVYEFNKIHTEVKNYEEMANVLECLAAKMESIDIKKFVEDTEKYNKISYEICKCTSEKELNEYLLRIYKDFGINIPWTGSFDSFMSNKTNKLVFS